MSGIAGIRGEHDEQRVRVMMDAMRHRGPDGEGHCELADGGALGHVRLAILDPANDRQPIHSDVDTTALVADSTVFNHRTLRRRLEGAPAFATGSDGETILRVFEENGATTPRALDGQFALAIASPGRLVLARDPIGVKPLYWARTGDDGRGPIHFASELNALAHLGTRVQEFPPGGIFDESLGLSRYYTVPDRPPVELEPLEHARRLRDGLEASVRKRLLSDVPLGAFLSEGLEDAIVAAVARRRVLRLRTFSAGVAGSAELEIARAVARHIGSEHHEHAYDEDEVVALLPEIVRHLESFDQDTVRAAIPTYFRARLAAGHVKVVLSGEGADELLAGHPHHLEMSDDGKLHRELRDSVARLHDLDLKRLDRMAMRHGVEARVPFLDPDLITVSQAIPPALKIERRSGARAVEKWILRKAFEDLLPPEIVWRETDPSEPRGAARLMAGVVERLADGLDEAAWSAGHPEADLRSREECLYHRLLSAQLARPETVLANVGRWRR